MGSILTDFGPQDGPREGVKTLIFGVLFLIWGQFGSFFALHLLTGWPGWVGLSRAEASWGDGGGAFACGGQNICVSKREITTTIE